MPNFILVQEVDSTNSYLKRNINLFGAWTVIEAYTQKAGRGQMGNSWEAAPGKNSTFSMLIKRPCVSVQEQFFISEAVSLAIVDTLEQYTTGFTIKWPNDIYHGDSKIGGILIEQSLDIDGRIEHSIVGVGVNLNQHMFTSGAPNPISLSNITGKEYSIEEVNHSICEKIEQYCSFDGSAEQLNRMHQRYLSKLYRNDGKPHQFTTPDGQQFEAIIHSVQPNGTITLRHTSDGTQHDYLFKEVGFVINRIKFL